MSLADQRSADTPRASSALRSVALIVNEAAGAASLTDVDKLIPRVAAALPNVSVHTIRVPPEQLEAEFDKVFAETHDAVVVLGGDGTARSAAKRAMRTGIPIAPLPGGTMNVLAKLVFGHADLAKAIDELGQSRVTTLDAGIVGGEPFFLSAAFGFAGPLAQLRESFRPPRQLQAMASATLRCGRALGPSLRGGVKWRRDEGHWRRAHTLVVALGSLDRVLTPEDEEMQTGERLQAAALKLKSGWDIARFGSDAVRLRDWRRFNQLEVTKGRRIELDVRSKRPLAVLDGEPMRLSQAHEVTVMEGALPVLAAPDRVNQE